jgi:hypothetical protein
LETTKETEKDIIKLFKNLGYEFLIFNLISPTWFNEPYGSGIFIKKYISDNIFENVKNIYKKYNNNILFCQSSNLCFLGQLSYTSSSDQEFINIINKQLIKNTKYFVSKFESLPLRCRRQASRIF